MRYNSNLFLASILILSLVFLLGFSTSKSKSEKIKYENFSLFDYNNKLHSLSDFSDKKGIVIIFVSTKCPVSNAYNSRMGKLFTRYNSEFSFVGINSNKSENIDEIKTHANDNNLSFTILKDSNNVIADVFQATVTPEVYVLNNNHELIYNGRIDDSRRIDNVEENDLDKVLKEIKNGNDISVSKTKAFGCSIKRI